MLGPLASQTLHCRSRWTRRQVRRIVAARAATCSPRVRGAVRAREAQCREAGTSRDVAQVQPERVPQFAE